MDSQFEANVQQQINQILAEQIDLVKSVNEEKEENRILYFDEQPFQPGPNPRQAELLEAYLDPMFKVFTFTGGNRLGKTTLLTILAICTMIGKYPWQDGFLANQSLLSLFNHNKPRKIRYIGQDWKEHIETVVIPELIKWWPESRPIKRKGNGIITDTFWQDLKACSTIEILSNNQDSRIHEGWKGDLILYDEPPKRVIRIANARGLIDRNGREVFAATLLGEPWIHQDIIKRRLENGRPDPSIFNVTGESYDNVGFGITAEGIEEFKKKLTDEEIEARIKGIPSYLSGLVYPEFKRRTHLVEPFEIPLDWMVDVAIDIHPRENQAVLFIATSPKNERFVFHEIWDHGDGTWVGESICRYVNRYNLRVNRIIVDPLAKGDKNNPNTTFDKIDEALYKHGMYLDTATKDKQSGIIEIRNHLKGPNNMPSIFFFGSLVRTVFEIESYMYDKDKQKPQDKDDHMMENLYRLLLLDTRWEEMDAYDHDPDDVVGKQSTRSKVTGY
jgi:hypothetical protein